MKRHLLFCTMMFSVAVLTGLALLSVSPAQAIPYDYSVTGTVTGTFNADLSVAGGSFNSWNLTTPVATFTNLSGNTFLNMNFALFQLDGINAFSFVIVPSTSIYGGTYSGGTGAGLFSGSFTQVAANVPEPGTVWLMLAGVVFLIGARLLPLRWELKPIA